MPDYFMPKKPAAKTARANAPGHAVPTKGGGVKVTLGNGPGKKMVAKSGPPKGMTFGLGETKSKLGAKKAGVSAGRKSGGSLLGSSSGSGDEGLRPRSATMRAVEEARALAAAYKARQK